MELEDDVTANKHQIENAKVSFWEKMVFSESVTQIDEKLSEIKMTKHIDFNKMHLILNHKNIWKLTPYWDLIDCSFKM